MSLKIRLTEYRTAHEMCLRRLVFLRNNTPMVGEVKSAEENIREAEEGRVRLASRIMMIELYLQRDHLLTVEPMRALTSKWDAFDVATQHGQFSANVTLLATEVALMEENLKALLTGDALAEADRDLVAFMDSSHKDFPGTPIEQAVSLLFEDYSDDRLPKMLAALSPEEFESITGHLVALGRALDKAGKMRVRAIELELIKRDGTEEDDFAGDREQLQREIKAQAMETEYGIEDEDRGY
jgi:hypothetical protein